MPNLPGMEGGSVTRTPPTANGRGQERILARRRSLPGGRSIIGAFLIALAAVIVFAAYTSATARPQQLYVVAAQPIAANTRLTADDLRLVPLDLPDAAVRAQVFGSTAPLLGASVLAPIASGALVEASAVVGRGGAVGTREVSVVIDRSRAVAGTLKVDEDVDLLGTFGSGADAYTTVMVPRLRIIAISNVSSSLGDTRTQLITFAAPTEVAAEAIADASVAAQMTLVRSAEPGSPAPTASTPETTPAYRAPGSPTARGGA
jgi:Flp pilus assembly protein CpaB